MTRPKIVLVTDPGPDPDDVKALLVAATMHTCRRGITLSAVICNGGDQPIERAKLARCVLDHVGLHDVPVGYGSEGKAYTAQPHEYDIAGFDSAQTRKRIQHGAALLLTTLRRAPSKSVVLVCISSLRDVADVCRDHEKLVLSKVREVAVQGGLERMPEGFGWAPDSSVNNGFDMDAARDLYAFCFRHALPLAVVSRNAVPLLPMQLASSFANRTLCPVIGYLANAQSLGLEGLWQKLCQGKLPPRCSKQWYFETFCGVDKDEFERAHLEELDGSAPIRARLNGYVKPYDVLALMTVLPSTRALFGAGVPAGDGVSFPERHRLFLRPEDTIDVSHVLKLLRDAYHSVVLITRISRDPTANVPEPPSMFLKDDDTGDATEPRQPNDARTFLDLSIEASPSVRDDLASGAHFGRACRRSSESSQSTQSLKERAATPLQSLGRPQRENRPSTHMQLAKPPIAALARLAASEAPLSPTCNARTGACAGSPPAAGVHCAAPPIAPYGELRMPQDKPNHESSGSWPISLQPGSTDVKGFFARARESRRWSDGVVAEKGRGVLSEAKIILLLERAHKYTLARRSFAGHIAHVAGIVLVVAGMLGMLIPVGLAAAWRVDMRFERCEQALGLSPWHCALIEIVLHQRGLAALGRAFLHAGVLILILGLMPVFADRRRIFVSAACLFVVGSIDALVCAIATAILASNLHDGHSDVNTKTARRDNQDDGTWDLEGGTSLTLIELSFVLAAMVLALTFIGRSLHFRLYSMTRNVYYGAEMDALRLLWAGGAVITSAFASVDLLQIGLASAVPQKAAATFSASTVALHAFDLVLSLVTVVVAVSPRLQRSAHSLFSKLSRRRSAFAPLALMSGFGTIDERTPAALVREALQCFVPVRLSARALRRLTFEARAMDVLGRPAGDGARVGTRSKARWFLRRHSKRASMTSAAKRARERREAEAMLSPEDLSVSRGTAGVELTGPVQASAACDASCWGSCVRQGSSITPIPCSATGTAPSAAGSFSARSKSAMPPVRHALQPARSSGHVAPASEASATVQPRFPAAGSSGRGGKHAVAPMSALEQLLQSPAAALQQNAGAALGIARTPSTAAHADFYVVHSWFDSASDKLRVLTDWSKQWSREHGRAPIVWLDALCADPLLLQREVLQHMAVYMARCRRLLLLCGPSLADRLWCVAECYAWRTSGGQLDSVDVLLVCPDGLSVEQRAAEWQDAVSAFDAFHVMWADAEEPQVRIRISAAIALATLSGVNEVIRSFMPVVQRAAKADLDALRALQRAPDGNSEVDSMHAAVTSSS